MSVIDHTVLLAFTQTPIYADQLIRQYALRRRIMIIPAHAMMLAARAAGPGPADVLAELGSTLYEPVIRWVDTDTETALRIGTTVLAPKPPGDNAEARWLAIAPVVWTARHLEQRIMTRMPALYDGYDLDVDRMP